MSLACFTRGKQSTDLRPPLTQVFVLRKQVLDRGVIQNHALPSSDYIAKERVGQVGGRHQRIVAVGPRPRRGRSWLPQRFYALRHAAGSEGRARPRVLDRACSMRVSISFSSTISPEHRLRRLDNRRQIQVFDRRADRASRSRYWRFFPEVRI